MTTYTAGSGTTSSGLTLGVGDQINIVGGVALATVVNDHGVVVVSSGGVASGTTVNAGGVEYVSSGGTASASTVNSGGYQNVSAGGQAFGTVVNNGGVEILVTDAVVTGAVVKNGGFLVVSAGGTAAGAVLSSGAIGYVEVGGTASGTTIKAGGRLVVLPGASNVGVLDDTGSGVVSTGVVGLDVSGVVQIYGAAATGVVLTSGSVIDVMSGGIASGTQIGSGGREHVFSGGIASAAVVGGGGLELVSSGGTARSVAIQSGGKLLVSSGGAANIVTVQSGGLLVLSAGATASGTSLNGGGTIDIGGLTFSSGGSVSVDDGTDILSVSFGGTSYTQQLAGLYTSASFHLADDNNGGTLVVLDSVACFLRGVRILTPSGEVAVEDLRERDLVTTLSGAARPIVWIGTGRSLVTPRNRCDVAPVIVRAGALADGVPARDLRLTRHHAVLVQSALIPVEHLINDVSVVWDDQARVIEYFHIELETHDILIADGAPAESFRDDNSAELFLNRDSHPGGGDPMPPCAPVIEAGEALEWAWTHIAARVAGNWAGDAADIWTDDPDLHLLADGQRIDAAWEEGSRRVFSLPRGTRGITISSRTAIPAVGGSSPDLRRLGVALGEVVLRNGDLSHALPADDPRLTDGFTAHEDGHRWTKGLAKLPDGLIDPSDEPWSVELLVVGSLRYRASLGQSLKSDNPPRSRCLASRA